MISWHGANYHLQKKAHIAFRKAILKKAIRPISRCEDCNRTESEIGVSGAPIVGHHEDYSRPLFVYWLCQDCHMERHSVGGWRGATRISPDAEKPISKRICITAFGATKTIREWSILTGITEASIRSAYEAGIPAEKLLTKSWKIRTFKSDWLRNWKAARARIQKRKAA